MKFNLGKKIKGIGQVSLSNILSLGVSLLTSFLLPMFISVEAYGYWQLFVLYTGYVGMFAFGFNDGVHVNYASADYSEGLAAKFKSFFLLLLGISAVETVVSAVALWFIFSGTDKLWVSIFVILNIIPVLLNGLFTYMNQSTMRFRQYAWGHMIDKIVFAAAMLVLIICGCENYLVYVCAYTLSRYTVIIYNLISSSEVTVARPHPFDAELKAEVGRNFKNGIPLMLAMLLNSSIIVGSRLIIENTFGIEDFGAFSFSIHTLVVASQFISAITSVFYPIMKRCGADELSDAYSAFDRISTLLSMLLLVSYYPAALLIHWLYPQYSDVLTYFTFIYPLFIFQCKSGLLITNMYKIFEKPNHLIWINGIGVALNIASALIAYFAFGTVRAIAIATLVGYVLWYYLGQLLVAKTAGWRLRGDMLLDLLVTSVFILSNVVFLVLFDGQIYKQLLFGALAFIAVSAIFVLVKFKYVKSTLKLAYKYLKD